MSTPEEPRFGQRSDSWSSEPDPQAGSAGSETPWPQYGSVPGAGSGTGAGAGSGSGTQPTTPYPQYGAPDTQGQGSAQASGGWGQQAPQQTPAPNQASPYGAGGAPGSMPGGAMVTDLPGRVGPVTLIISSLLVMLIAAPAVFMGFMMGGMDLEKVVQVAQQTTNGGTVTVEGTDGIMVLSANTTADSSLSCKLTDSSGKEIPMTSPQLEGVPVPGAQQAEGIPAGTYTVNCENLSGDQLLTLPTNVFNSMFSGIMGGVGKGFLWATLVGLIGLGMLIGGIVWLVRTNRRRQEIQRQAWFNGQGGGYGGGFGGGQAPGTPPAGGSPYGY